MQTQEIRFPFPSEATERDKVVLAIASPYTFMKWCRTRVGRAPNTFTRGCDGCVVEEYLYDVAGARVVVESQGIHSGAQQWRYVVTPKWVQQVIIFVDVVTRRRTYNDVANMVMTAIQLGEIA